MMIFNLVYFKYVGILCSNSNELDQKSILEFQQVAFEMNFSMHQSIVLTSVGVANGLSLRTQLFFHSLLCSNYIALNLSVTLLIRHC